MVYGDASLALQEIGARLVRVTAKVRARVGARVTARVRAILR